MGRFAQFIKLGFLAVLMAIHCLGPLLHAHMGTPLQSGFHLDLPSRGLSRVVQEERSRPDQISAWGSEREPFSVEVEKGVRTSHAFDFDPVLIESLLALCAVLLVLRRAGVCWPLPRRFIRHRQRWRGGSSRPPPAQAPPLHS